MTARADQIVVPAPLRWLRAAAIVAAAAAVIMTIRDRARQPRVQPMSDEWLRSHSADREYHSSW